MKKLTSIILLLTLGYVHAGDSSTQSPINRGAARQMFGSGNLRQTGASTISLGTTVSTVEEASNKQSHGDKDDRSHVPGHREDPQLGHGYGFGGSKNHHVKPHSQVPPGFYPRNPKTDDDYEEIDGPSYRNGAPVNGMRLPISNGGLYGQSPHGMSRGGLTRARGRDGYYGSIDGGGYYGEVPDRSRFNNGLSRGHGISPIGEPDPDRFGPDKKDLLHELDDESDANNMYTTCRYNCVHDQFLCVSTCDCIDMYLRCDGSRDCESGEDEIDCEDIFEARKSNGTCYGERGLLCPESGYCIAQQWLCDGDDDCGDYSDESNCGNQKNCTQDQFKCRNGLCVQQSWRCDGENDCRDFSDEENCSEKKKCREDEFTCPDGSCLLKHYLCDGENDCDDGSDEFKCHGNHEVDCDENYFECSTAKCIRKEYRCDGSDDCGDASDEENCPNLSDCNANQFKCENGYCISKVQVCDGHHDCNAGEDEANCEHLTPHSCSTTDEFACSTGKCISRSWVCDGVPDCSNSEDEENCPLICDATQYLCKTPPASNETTAINKNPASALQHVHAYCISKKHLCDGLPDCPLKEDELNCPKKRNCTSSDKCNQQCILTVNNEKACACDSGFALGSDNTTCHDVNECEFTREPVCSQLCNNTYGSFVCGCITGYVLKSDSRTCKAIGGNPSLIFTNRVDIRKVSLGPTSDTKYTPILKSLHNAIAMDYHYEKGLIYWSDVSLDMIKKVYVNGSSPEDVIRWGLESPGGVAIDWIHDLLFWTDSGTRRVEVITLETKVRHVLVSTDLDKPRAIAVHPHYGYVFWTDWGPSPKIERADMDGSGRQSLITDSIVWPNGLTIDYPTERIYWTDAKHPAIMSAKLDGTDRKKVLSKGLHHPFAITVFEDLMYWTDWHFKSISSANKANGKGFKTIRSGLHFPMDLHSYHKQRQPSYPNHCGNNNGKCSHMCLPNSAGYSCVCPVGLKIKHDGKNCATTIDNLLIFARKRDLRLIPIDQSTRVFDTVIPVDHVQSAVALTWDAEQEMIYWTDVESDVISKAHLNGSNQSIVINHNLESPAGLAMDWITKKLYWTDSGTNKVECSNLDGTMRTLLVHEGLDKPRDIVVDPTVGYMYWSDWGEKPKIERAAMDGSRRRVFIGEKIMWPNSLAIDFATKRLYWADGGMKSIEYVDLEGKGKRVRVRSDLPHPFGLTIHQNKIYWTDWDTKSIHRADKDTGENATVVRAQLGNLMDVRAFHRNRKIVPNPCKDNNGKCSHLCLLTPDPARYKCACPTGLILESNQRKCRTIPHQFLVFAHRVDIRVISFDVNYKVDVVLPIDYLKNASGVDVNRRTGDVYWTDPGADVITRANFDGKNVRTIVNTGIDTADSLVVDSVGRKLYWTDAGLNSIEVCELDGKNRKVLIWSGLDNPRAIAVHYAKGLIFWTDWGHNARIERANMDGKERATVIADNLVWPNGLSIDTEHDKLYWNDAKRKLIEVSDLDGSNRKALIKSVQHPYGLAVMGDYIYWSDWQTKSIHQANKTSGADIKIVVNKLDGIMDVRAISSKNMQGIEDVCSLNNGGCSHLCLRNPRGYTCACPTGILLKEDNKTCHSSPKNFLLFAARKSLARISFDTPEKWEESLPIADIHNAYSADFHWNKSLIVYTDINLRVIRTVNMHNFSDVKTIFTEPENSEHMESSPFKIAVDWLANNIYWTNMKKRTIEIARIDGSNRKCLLKDLDTPWSIALFPKLGYMFWTEWGKESNIQRALLDGSNKKAIIKTDLYYPNGLSIDYEKRKLYWADTVKDRIEMSDLNGYYRIQLVPAAERPYGLSQYGEYIYWAGWDQTSVKRADKATGDSWINIRTSLHGITDVKAVSSDRQKGWNPCFVDNGGCSHICFFTKNNYTCACPDIPDPNCSTVPSKYIAIRKPGTENDPDYDEHDENEKPPEVITRSNPRDIDDKFDSYKNKDNGHTLLIITIVVFGIITVAIVIAIFYLLCQRKPKQEQYMYTNRRNVLTFSNPNYNASGADVGPSNPPTEKKSFIWKRLKYDSSQERVYEDNGQTPSPEVVSLIPPSATPSSSRAPSVTPRESSPSLIHVTHLNG